MTLLEAYAKRVGITTSAKELEERAAGDPQTARQLLDELMAAHTQSIPFENLDIVALSVAGERRTVPTDAASVIAKMIDGNRGGYCHEHGAVVRQVIAALGLRVYPILGRIHRPLTRDGEPNTVPSALTHQANIVVVGGQKFLLDPGFGAGTPEYALEIGSAAGDGEFGGAVRGNARVEHRVVEATGAIAPELIADSQWVLQVRSGLDAGGAGAGAGNTPEFRSVYAFSEMPRGQAELDVANWYTGTKPGAHFTGPPLLAKYLPGGGKVTINATEFSIDVGPGATQTGAQAARAASAAPHPTQAAGEGQGVGVATSAITNETRTLASQAEFDEVLRTYFGITVDADLLRVLWRRATEAGPR